MKKRVKTISSLDEMSAFSTWFIDHYLFESKNKATVVFLSGDLGSGKTTFMRTLARNLGITSRITSPTFVLEKRYQIPDSSLGYKTLIHIDAYRLSGGELREALDLERVTSEPKNLVCIEWPENFDTASLKADTHILFDFVDENTRKIQVC